ncbi:MAG TPA: LPS assembly protein LptD [Acidisphaera sp.]|nr:LPS assembly protein LptD [Acidisphaera sp.]
MRRVAVGIALMAALALLLPLRASSQGALSALGGRSAPINTGQPVTFTADQVTYDRDSGVVTASGHVEAWQNDRVLRADKITFDRNTNVATAVGHVVLLEPDGQVLFSDYAELTEGMKDAVLRGLRAQLAENGKLAANGARRTGGEIDELTRVVYSTCNVCKQDPNHPPLWQIRAYSAVQDLENKRIEFYDAVLQMEGIPVGYSPYFNIADPSVRRASGLLIPTVGYNSRLGAFTGIPYYAVLDDQSDATITPLFTTKAGENLALQYRRRFNDGTLSIDASGADVNGQAQGAVYALGKFDYDDTWRYGFTIDRASSVTYLEDYQLGRFFGGLSPVLTSDGYVEGFGDGAYSRLDTRFYQGLVSSISTANLPIVLPRYTYSYVGPVDDWGGRLSVDTQDFNVIRTIGTNTQRASLSATYSRPFTGYIGDQWQVQFHLDAAAYNATQLNQQPNWSTIANNSTERAQPQGALDWRWPLVRDSGSWGTQVIEPHIQVVSGPNTGDSQFNKIPNEDALDLQFTDSNLFGWNYLPGIDRLFGGTRLNVAMRSAWYLNGTVLEGQVGEAYQTEVLNALPPGTGLNHHATDYVGHVGFSPAPWLSLLYRTRLNQSNFKTELADATATVGGDPLAVTLGYIYTSTNPYTLYNQNPQAPNSDYLTPRDEITAGFTAKHGFYRVSAYARRDLQLGQMVALGAEGAYEDECYIFDVRFSRLYTNYNGTTPGTTVLFSMTFKSVGSFGFHAF